MTSEELPEWLDKTAVSTVGVLTIDDGVQITAEIVEFDEERSELVLDVIHQNRSTASSLRGRQIIPIERIASFDPQARAAQPWPYSDPCRSSPFSLARLALLTTLFLCMTAGGLALFILWAKKPYGIQGASAIVYTLSEVFLTFAATRGWRRYLFTCPAVRPKIPSLLRRHIGFVVALFLLQTIVLAARPSLPGWWNAEDSKGGTPFELALLLLCIGLGWAQVFSSRSLLDRAHREFCTKG